MSSAQAQSRTLLGHHSETIAAWRGIASLAVVFFHSFGAFSARSIWAPLRPVQALSLYGWAGLDLFFVISGYCIFQRLGTAVRRRESVPAFWSDRALRILPTYWAALAVTLLVNLATWPFNHGRLADNFPLSVAGWLGELSVTRPLFDAHPLLLVSWTLTCELGFYAAAGLLLAVNRGSHRLLPAFAAGWLLCVLAGFAPERSWLLPLQLWPNFFAGCCTWMAAQGWRARDWRRAGAGLGGLASLTAALVLGLGTFGGSGRSIAVGFAWILLALLPLDSWLGRWAPVRLLTWVGAFSYSLYLIHVQVMTRVLNLGTRTIAPTGPLFAALWVVAVGLAIAAGWAFWRLVEGPCEQWRHRRLARRRTAAAPAS